MQRVALTGGPLAGDHCGYGVCCDQGVTLFRGSREEHREAAEAVMSEFFEAGRTYRHYRADGTPSTEGWFLVEFVGRPPKPFEDEVPASPLGVAFGWRRGLSLRGVVEGLGEYTSPDFVGWREEGLPPDVGSDLG